MIRKIVILQGRVMKNFFVISVILLLISSCSRLEEPTVSWYLAIERGDLEQVERHIHWNTNINEPFENGNFPIHEAASKGRIILLKILLKNGAEIDAINKNELTPLEVAILAGRTQAAELLISSNSKFDPSKLLLIAAKNGNEDKDVIKFLKSSNANFEITDVDGYSPLLLAVIQKNNRLIRHLIDNGANINASNKFDQTALDIALKMNDSKLIEFLKRNGAIQFKSIKR
tara:strand:- start:11274 stop:11963 length:690 start_codon:yes stop_codon:yes gene_type:complete